MSLDNFLLKPSQTTCGDVWPFLKGFLTPRLNNVLKFSSCGPWRVFSHSNSPSHRALGRYRHTFFSTLFRNIFCWLEILNYCPDGGNGNFHCSSSFLKATSLICKAQFSFAAHQKYILFYFIFWWMIKGFLGFVFPHIYFSVKQEAMAGWFHVHNHPGVLKIENILQRYFTHKNFLGCQ